MKFKATARRDKLLGLWAAEKLNLSGAAAEAYAKELVLAELKATDDNDILRRICADFAANGVQQSEHQIRRTMDQLMEGAIRLVRAEK